MSLLVFLPFLCLFATLFISSISALPVKARQDEGFRILAQDEVDSSFLRPALFARFAYCDPVNVPDLSCGGPCEPLKDDVEVLISGGDGGEVPHFLVAHDRLENTIVVAHEGTNSDDPTSILNDLEFNLVPLNTAKFPLFVDSGAEIHDGFQDSFYGGADDILTAVQDALISKKSSKLLLTGHSLGGALAVMDAMMFKQVLDPSIDIKTITFGTPRSGNQEWADLVDQTLDTDHIFITNKNDIVPQLPFRSFGYRHSTGEVHIRDDKSADFITCPGQENESDRCSFGDTRFLGLLLGFSVSAHKGPYFNDISFAHSECPLVEG
ncbi:alpha/beta-hydrolase [Flagelloscypha sp. PMI_526]|nr:alpha/beta-hydrolase [Flagelloscypha sp. PMI_526]